jgi:hypothetical protein
MMRLFLAQFGRQLFISRAKAQLLDQHGTSALIARNTIPVLGLGGLQHLGAAFLYGAVEVDQCVLHFLGSSGCWCAGYFIPALCHRAHKACDFIDHACIVAGIGQVNRVVQYS